MLIQLHTNPIFLEQLVVEVNAIYAGLVMVEAKCEIDSRHVDGFINPDTHGVTHNVGGSKMGKGTMGHMFFRTSISMIV